MLHDIRVIELSGPETMMAGRILGDLGADVIVVEPPGGAAGRRLDPFLDDTPGLDRSLTWHALNSGQARHHARPRHGRRACPSRGTRPLGRTAAGNGRPKGNGTEGRCRLPRLDRALPHHAVPVDRPEARLPRVRSHRHRSHRRTRHHRNTRAAPLFYPVPQAMMEAGAEAAIASLAALSARDVDGLGQDIEVPARLAGMMSALSVPIVVPANNPELQRTPARQRLAGVALPGIFACKDGFVLVSFAFGQAFGRLTQRLMQWAVEQNCLEARLGAVDWSTAPQQAEKGSLTAEDIRATVDAIATLCLRHTKDEFGAEARKRGLLAAPLMDMRDIGQSPQYRERGLWSSPVTVGAEGRTVDDPARLRPVLELHDRCARGPPRRCRSTLPRFSRPNSVCRLPKCRRCSSTASSEDIAMKGPLDGLRVLDMGWVMVGPVTGRYLADLGADVVKLESSRRVDPLRTLGPFKDGKPGLERSISYHNLNAGKRSLTVDIKDPRGREAILRLVEWADVLIESFSPGVLDDLDLAYPVLKARNPALIVASTSLLGQTGPHARGTSGVGTMGASMSGASLLLGWPGHPPCGTYGPWTDAIAPRFIVPSILAALHRRRATGEGCHIDVAQAEAGIQFLSPAWYQYAANGTVMERRGHAGSPLRAPHGIFRCAGPDRWIALDGSDEDRLAGPAYDSSVAPSSIPSSTPSSDAYGDDKSSKARSRPGPFPEQADELERSLQAAGVPAHVVSQFQRSGARSRPARCPLSSYRRSGRG